MKQAAKEKPRRSGRGKVGTHCRKGGRSTKKKGANASEVAGREKKSPAGEGGGRFEAMRPRSARAAGQIGAGLMQ
jgi:hypothetical protein